MKAPFVVLLGILSAQTCFAAGAEKWYYAGEVKLSSESGQPIGSQAMLVEKTHDPDHSLIVERAIVVKPDGGVDDYTMNMPVKGNTFTIDDPKKMVEGSGTLFGPAWHWTYFKAIYKATNGVQIDDENFMADPEAGTARKKISAPNGKVVMYMDMTLKAISPRTFEILTSALLKKGNPPKQ